MQASQKWKQIWMIGLSFYTKDLYLVITQKLTFALFMTRCGFHEKRAVLVKSIAVFVKSVAVFVKSIAVFERPLARNCNPMIIPLMPDSIALSVGNYFPKFFVLPISVCDTR